VAYTSEIDKLERRYAENPEGRNFAPLADAYRKAGQLDQAVELLTGGLERHPDYVSAHIVLGRCLIDQKNETGAGEVFRKVLSLDPENVIAFKVLAEIADRGKRYDEAVDWLTRLIAADPMNGDAAEALSVARGKAAASAASAPPPPPPPPPVPPPAPSYSAAPAPTAELDVSEPEPGVILDLGTEEPPVVEQLSEPPQPVSQPPGELEVYDGTLDLSSVANQTARADGIELQEEVDLKPSPIAIEGLARTQYEGSGVFKVDAPADAGTEPPAEEDLPIVDLPLIMPEDPLPPSQRPVAAAATFAPPPPPPPPTPPPAPLPAPLPAPSPVAAAAVSAARPERGVGRSEPPVAAAVTLSDDDGAADTAALSKVEPLVTETMAELYLRQGHEEDARRVYEALLAQRPQDARLRARVQELRNRDQAVPAQSGRGETVRVFLKNILTGRNETRASADEHSPIDAAFEQVHESDIPGNPTHAATDSISLDEVFGEGGAPVAAPLSEPPPPGAVPPPAPPAASGGFSFDDFFGSKSAPGASAQMAPPPASDAAPAAPSKPGSRPSGSRGKLPMEDESDLDQFQAWLKGLKA